MKNLMNETKQLEEEIKNLFSVIDVEDKQKEVNLVVENMIKGFLGSDRISTSTTLQQLKDDYVDSKFQEECTDLIEYFQELKENILSNCINTYSPKFIGHMASALPSFVKPVSMLVSCVNQNNVKTETSKIMTILERQSLAMLNRLYYERDDNFYSKHIQNSESTLGIVTSGGTLANLTALWCARNVALQPQGDFLGVEKEGLIAALRYYNYTDAVIIGPKHMHYSLNKVVDIIGIGSNNLLFVPNDGNDKMDLQALCSVIEECKKKRKLIIAIVAVAGSTEAGDIDSLQDIAEISKKYQIHFHVDAAWGGAIQFSEKHKKKLEGIQNADSITIDAHKQLYLPMGIGCVLFKNPYYAKAIEKTAHYIIRKDSSDLGKCSVEGSRPSSNLYLHAAFNIIGHKGYGYLIDEGIRKIQFMTDYLRQIRNVEIIKEPQTNILLYRFIPNKLVISNTKRYTKEENNIINEYNKCIQKIQRQRGTSFVSRTTINLEKYGENTPIVVLRTIIANILVTENHIIEVIEEQIEIARGIECKRLFQV